MLLLSLRSVGCAPATRRAPPTATRASSARVLARGEATVASAAAPSVELGAGPIDGARASNASSREAPMPQSRKRDPHRISPLTALATAKPAERKRYMPFTEGPSLPEEPPADQAAAELRHDTYLNELAKYLDGMAFSAHRAFTSAQDRPSLATEPRAVNYLHLNSLHTSDPERFLADFETFTFFETVLLPPSIYYHALRVYTEKKDHEKSLKLLHFLADNRVGLDMGSLSLVHKFALEIKTAEAIHLCIELYSIASNVYDRLHAAAFAMPTTVAYDMLVHFRTIEDTAEMEIALPYLRQFLHIMESCTTWSRVEAGNVYLNMLMKVGKTEEALRFYWTSFSVSTNPDKGTFAILLRYLCLHRLGKDALAVYRDYLKHHRNARPSLIAWMLTTAAKSKQETKDEIMMEMKKQTQWKLDFFIFSRALATAIGTNSRDDVKGLLELMDECDAYPLAAHALQHYLNACFFVADEKRAVKFFKRITTLKYSPQTYGYLLMTFGNCPLGNDRFPEVMLACLQILAANDTVPQSRAWTAVAARALTRTPFWPQAMPLIAHLQSIGRAGGGKQETKEQRDARQAEEQEERLAKERAEKEDRH